MKTVSIHEAKAQLSKLIEEARKGEPFIISKAGKPVVKVTAVTTPPPVRVRRIGFMAGQFSVPDDFESDGQGENRAALRRYKVEWQRDKVPWGLDVGKVECAPQGVSPWLSPKDVFAAGWPQHGNTICPYHTAFF